MITKNRARELVIEKLAESGLFESIVILDSETLERGWGWVFFYQDKKYIETGDFRDMLVGNAPYMVNKFSGDVIETGTANDIEHYIKEYEETL